MDVVFVVMPFADVGRPAIGVSLLKAAAAHAGYSSAITYGSIQLASIIGTDLYHQISTAFPPDLLVGEWFFADDVFANDIPDADDYLAQVVAKHALPATIDVLRAARRDRSRYLDAVTETIAAQSPRIVGFTTTFHQTCASLAIARRLKARPNPPAIVFGGANCEGEMGVQMLASFPWIDYVSCGESEHSFVKLIDHLLRGGPEPQGGVLSRTRGQDVIESQVVREMDDLPYPDYDDYFEQIERSALGRAAAHHLIIETSRGCWWGAKHHCTFCGLNGETMAFRSKSADRAYDEIVALCRKYGLSRVACVDNILDMRYIDTLFPKLAASGLELELFYEVKSNLRYDQLVKMHRGGMRQIQPGIESFSNHVLKLMDKGVTGFQNIQLMRWCKEIGIECAWNVLGGFPGEDKADYDAMAALIPSLTHLDPPCSCAQVRLDRFSPFHSRAAQYGFRKLRPSRAYFFVFPFGRRELERLAYFFDYDYDDGRRPETYLEGVQRAVQRWWQTRKPDAAAALDAWFKEDGTVEVTDTREAARHPHVVLTGLRARLFTICDVSTTVAALLRDPALTGYAGQVQHTLDSLVSDGLMAHEAGHYLTLAVFRNRLSAPVPNAHGHDAPAQAAASRTLLPVV